ncbi:hypothetical protein ACVWXN_002114 [Bradyrhizobium sp. i1.4.4]
MGPAAAEALPVGKFLGIGPATSAKMNSLSLYTGPDMRTQMLEFMQANFGRDGTYFSPSDVSEQFVGGFREGVLHVWRGA